MLRRALCLLALIVLLFPSAGAYSVLTHEELIDLAWTGTIRPLLQARYPNATEAQLRVAHAYAYGGCAIQDMGYYPFGSEFFSDLTHYVRSGDFVANLFQESRDLNEYAFAIGALSHYLGDSIGHADAVNPATAVEFPDLERRYGPSVTYDEDPHAHVRTEFAFDIDQLAKKRLAPGAYLRYIGFEVPHRLLEQAFRQTYGMPLRDVLGKRTDAAIRSYRTSVRTFIPAFANAEVVLHGSQFPPDTADPEFQLFSARLQQAWFERRWKRSFEPPGFGSHLLAALIFIIPKVGAISDLAIKIPDPETERWYIRSVNHTLDRYLIVLAQFKQRPSEIALTDLDLDTGAPSRPGAYRLTDQTYARLLQRVSTRNRRIPAGLRADILHFYADLNAPIDTKRDPKAWQRVLSELERLRAQPGPPTP